MDNQLQGLGKFTCHDYKVVLVVGATGVGKSTLVNMLFNQDTASVNLTQPCPTGTRSRPVTSNSVWLLNPRKTPWIVYGDCVGFDGSGTEQRLKVAEGIKRLLKMLKCGVHSIILVAEYGRYTWQRSNFRALRQLFGERWHDCCSLVLTRCWRNSRNIDDYNTWKQAQLDELFQGDEEMNGFIRQLGDRVLITNNVTDEHDPELATQTQPLKEKTLDALNSILLASTRLYEVDSALDDVKSQAEKFQGFIRDVLDFHSEEELLRFCEDFEKVKVASCECGICYEPMELMGSIWLSCCRQVLNSKCASQICGRQMGCPYCRSETYEANYIGLKTKFQELMLDIKRNLNEHIDKPNHFAFSYIS